MRSRLVGMRRNSAIIGPPVPLRIEGGRNAIMPEDSAKWNWNGKTEAATKKWVVKRLLTLGRKLNGCSRAPRIFLLLLAWHLSLRHCSWWPQQIENSVRFDAVTRVGCFFGNGDQAVELQCDISKISVWLLMRGLFRLGIHLQNWSAQIQTSGLGCTSKQRSRRRLGYQRRVSVFWPPVCVPGSCG